MDNEAHPSTNHPRHYHNHGIAPRAPVSISSLLRVNSCLFPQMPFLSPVFNRCTDHSVWASLIGCAPRRSYRIPQRLKYFFVSIRYIWWINLSRKNRLQKTKALAKHDWVNRVIIGRPKSHGGDFSEMS